MPLKLLKLIPQNSSTSGLSSKGPCSVSARPGPSVYAPDFVRRSTVTNGPRAFELRPLDGCNDITFGMQRVEVRRRLGEPENADEASVLSFEGFDLPSPAVDRWYESEFQVHYDDDLRVEFIELHGREAEHTRVTICGLDAFNIPAVALIGQLSEKLASEFDASDDEIPHSYVWREWDVALWRQVAPEDEPDTEEHDGHFFWTVSIGRKGYFGRDDEL